MTLAMSYGELLDHLHAVRDRLAGETGFQAWSTLWKTLNLWELLQAGSDAVAEEAQVLCERHREVDGKAKRKATRQLAIVAGSRDEERHIYFQLALYWRRYAIWQHLRTRPADIEGARAELQCYFPSASATSGPATSRICTIAAYSGEETALLLSTARKVRDRLRILRTWQAEHPDAAALLKDPKGKGKSRENVGDAGTTSARRAGDAYQPEAQAMHFRRLIDDIEPSGRLEELVRATKGWLDAFERRMMAVVRAETVLTRKTERPIAARQSRLSPVGAIALGVRGGEEQDDTKDHAVGSARSSPELDSRMQTSLNSRADDREGSRPKTVSRGTSPILPFSTVQSQGRKPDLEKGSQAMKTTSTISSVRSQAQAITDENTPPSPTSLPSRSHSRDASSIPHIAVTHPQASPRRQALESIRREVSQKLSSDGPDQVLPPRTLLSYADCHQAVRQKRRKSGISDGPSKSSKRRRQSSFVVMPPRPVSLLSQAAARAEEERQKLSASTSKGAEVWRNPGDPEIWWEGLSVYDDAGQDLSARQPIRDEGVILSAPDSPSREGAAGLQPGDFVNHGAFQSPWHFPLGSTTPMIPLVQDEDDNRSIGEPSMHAHSMQHRRSSSGVSFREIELDSASIATNDDSDDDLRDSEAMMNEGRAVAIPSASVSKAERSKARARRRESREEDKEILQLFKGDEALDALLT